MQQPLVGLKRFVHASFGAVALGVLLLSACENLDAIGIPHDDIQVRVTGDGLGVGLVSSPAPADLHCTITAGFTAGDCSSDFEDAGRGGSFTLTAAPAAGSRFGGFHGCNSVKGLNCELTFEGTGGLHQWYVVATFELEAPPPPGSNLVRFKNYSHSLQAYLVGPGEAPGPDNAVEPDHERLVTIPSAVGTPSLFRVYLPPDILSASLTCVVTATAWQGGAYPLVGFWDNEGRYLTCDGGLVAP